MDSSAFSPPGGHDATAPFHIQLADRQTSDWRMLYIGGRSRYATATSVRILDAETLVCCSLLARKMELIRFDDAQRTWRVLDCIDTVFAGSTAETDLCDADAHGNILTSNCALGTVTHYRRDGDRLAFVRDLPTGFEKSWAHGVRFFTPDIFAVTLSRGEEGVHFFDLKTGRRLLFIPSQYKVKDVCFLSDTRLIMVVTDGAPRPQEQAAYHGGVELVEFSLALGSHAVLGRKIFAGCHFDAASLHDGKLYITSGLSDGIFVVDTVTLEKVDEIGGYHVPHGIDINLGMMAVTSYADNTVTLTRISAKARPAARPFPARRRTRSTKRGKKT